VIGDSKGFISFQKAGASLPTADAQQNVEEESDGGWGLGVARPAISGVGIQTRHDSDARPDIDHSAELRPPPRLQSAEEKRREEAQRKREAERLLRDTK
jgi:hypothetical protein